METVIRNSVNKFIENDVATHAHESNSVTVRVNRQRVSLTRALQPSSVLQMTRELTDGLTRALQPSSAPRRDARVRFRDLSTNSVARIALGTLADLPELEHGAPPVAVPNSERLSIVVEAQTRRHGRQGRALRLRARSVGQRRRHSVPCVSQDVVGGQAGLDLVSSCQGFTPLK
jgi:hypothetical protein